MISPLSLRPVLPPSLRWRCLSRLVLPASCLFTRVLRPLDWCFSRLVCFVIVIIHGLRHYPVPVPISILHCYPVLPRCLCFYAFFHSPFFPPTFPFCLLEHFSAIYMIHIRTCVHSGFRRLHPLLLYVPHHSTSIPFFSSSIRFIHLAFVLSIHCPFAQPQPHLSLSLVCICFPLSIGARQPVHTLLEPFHFTVYFCLTGMHVFVHQLTAQYPVAADRSRGVPSASWALT